MFHVWPRGHRRCLFLLCGTIHSYSENMLNFWQKELVQMQDIKATYSQKGLLFIITQVERKMFSLPDEGNDVLTIYVVLEREDMNVYSLRERGQTDWASLDRRQGDSLPCSRTPVLQRCAN